VLSHFHELSGRLPADASLIVWGSFLLGHTRKTSKVKCCQPELPGRSAASSAVGEKPRYHRHILNRFTVALRTVPLMSVPSLLEGLIIMHGQED